MFFPFFDGFAQNAHALPLVLASQMRAKQERFKGENVGFRRRIAYFVG
jgi:hypothetical protein